MVNTFQANEAIRLASLAEQYEELLVLIWKLEREWAFDDRMTVGTPFRSSAARRNP